MDKQKVHTAAVDLMKSKILLLQKEMDGANSSLGGATKSSAGDKHETSRAMIQLEQERISNQITKSKHLLEILLSIKPSADNDIVQSGSLVKTDRGHFYLSAGIGMVQVDSQDVFCLSVLTPMGKLLLGKKKGDSIQLNGEVEILEVI